jgi:hypothetical protein
LIPFTNERGLRDYRVHVARDRPRWPWLVLIAGLIVLLFGVRR